MPQSARLDAPGVVRHVIIREIERGKIFKDSQPCVVYTVNNGEMVAKERNYQLLE